jgi:hypothetical protein
MYIPNHRQHAGIQARIVGDPEHFMKARRALARAHRWHSWCRARSLNLFAIRRADIEGFARDDSPNAVVSDLLFCG